MKFFVQFTLAGLAFSLIHFQAQAAFTSFHVFGDSISTTASNSLVSSLYYGKRYSNGRVWVEVLAQQQGLAFNPTSNTNSFFGNTSTNLAVQINSYNPADASNSLVVIWVNNADFYYPVLNSGTNIGVWTNVINVSQTNHFKAITNLYAKGIRFLVMPNMVDVSMVPFAINYANTNFLRQRCNDYNIAFNATLNQARSNCPGLNIYVPNFFALLTNITANPTSYGVTNALSSNGRSIDALDAGLTDTNGPGALYIYWDYTDPTAKVHNWMASLAQQLISPVQIAGITAFDGSNRLDVVNVPVGQNGIVVGSGDLSSGNWTTNLTFSSTNTSQSVWVTNTGPQWFYKLSFPVVWTWP